MMYPARLLSLSLVLLGLSSQIRAHAIITPALGVSGAPTRNDVQRPSASAECGSVDVASALAASGSAVLSEAGTFSANVTNFNRCAVLLLFLFCVGVVIRCVWL